jgi:hypothetical protein
MDQCEIQRMRSAQVVKTAHSMHGLNEWTNREGELIGASVFLMAEEARVAPQGDTIEIEITR